MASIFGDSQGVIMIDYHEQCRTINGAYYVGELRRLRQCSAPGGQRPSPYVTSCMTAATECGFEMLSRHLYILLIWLLLRRRHSCSKRVLGDQEKAFYFEGIRKLEQRWAKCIALKRFYIEK